MKFNPFLFGVLRDAAGDDPAGGGGDTKKDPPAAALTIEQVNDIVNRAVANVKREMAKKDPPATDKVADPPPDPKHGDKGDSPSDKALARKLSDMQAIIDQLKSENEQTKKVADSKDLDSLLRGELGKFDFAASNANEDLFSILRPKIKRTEEGIFSEDGFSLEEFVKKSYEGRPHLHPAKAVGGSGAQTGSRGKSSIDLNDIKPGMSADQRNAAWADLAKIMGK